MRYVTASWSKFSLNLSTEEVCGYIPLHYASLFVNLEVCKVILESTENKNPVADDGDTALHCAAEGSNLELLRNFPQLWSRQEINKQWMYTDSCSCI